MKLRAGIVFGLVSALVLGGARRSEATWSVVVADSRTGEVGVASVTCLTTIDLRALTPVVLVGVGTAAVQSAGDSSGTRRSLIHDELLAGTSPADLLTLLAGITGHESRQYGIADTQGRTVTFSGASNGAWASGETDESTSLVYAIQGNVLAGECVVLDTEAAFVATSGDMAEKLMAAMEAARDAGGDGRCSCRSSAPTSCGCPVTGKSGHIGYIIVARKGDIDDPSCTSGGCADGDYYLNLNFPLQPSSAPDPVDQLRGAFDTWRAGLTGRPDAIRSSVSIAPLGGDYEMRIELRDWEGSPVPSALSVRVAHEASSAGISAIGPVTALGGGVFTATLTPAPGMLGVDRFRVTADDGVRAVALMPCPELVLDAACISRLSAVRRLLAWKDGLGGANFQWDADAAASEYHVNSVPAKAALFGEGPYRLPLPGSLASIGCEAPAPVLTCSDGDALDVRAPQLFYQALSACGSTGDLEGPSR